MIFALLRVFTKGQWAFTFLLVWHSGLLALTFHEGNTFAAMLSWVMLVMSLFGFLLSTAVSLHLYGKFCADEAMKSWHSQPAESPDTPE